MPTVICDRDHVVAASGIQKKEVLERRVSSSLEDLIEQRKSLYHKTADDVKMNPIEGVNRFAIACAPILAEGDVNGAVIMLSDNENSVANDKQTALVEAAALYFGRQMEQI